MNLSYPVCSQLIRSSWYYWLQLHSAMPLDMSCLMYHLQLLQYLSHTPLKVENFEEKASFTNFISILHLLAWWKSFWTYLSVCIHVLVNILFLFFIFKHEGYNVLEQITSIICSSWKDCVQLSFYSPDWMFCSWGSLTLSKLKFCLWFLTASLAWWWQCCGLIFVGTHWCIWSTMCA